MAAFPSIVHIINSVKAVARRFPVELLFALTGCIAATIYTEVYGSDRAITNWNLRIVLCADIGLVLTLSASLYAESRAFLTGKKWMFRLFAVVLAIVFLLLINPQKQESDYVRFFLITLSLHLLVSFVAFGNKTGINGFWQFNKTLFLRILAGALYATVLFAGLSAAIGSMNFLFGFNFEWDTFLILWIWITGLFLTVFFLAGVPHDFEALEKETAYPKGLKVFTQFVLIPLATVYVLILLAYELKILIQWNLPKGLVSNLILGYAVFGILSLLLIFPVRNEAENKWIRSYSHSFYLLLLPLIILLIVAVLFRVLPYGITVPRYFLLVLAGWLTLITFYFLFSKAQNIRIIPVSLAIFTLLTVYGPQSAFSVAETSQINTLKSLFKKYGAFDGKNLKPLNLSKIDSTGKKRIHNVADYVVKEFGLESLQGIMKPNLQNISDSIWNKQKDKRVSRYSIRYTEQEWLNKQLNIPDYSGRAIKADPQYRYVLSENQGAFSTAGARYVIMVDKDSTTVNFDGIRYTVIQNNNSNQITISTSKNTVQMNLGSLLDTLENQVVKPDDKNPNGNFKAPQKWMKTVSTGNNEAYTIYWTSINYSVIGKRKILHFAKGYLLIK